LKLIDDDRACFVGVNGNRCLFSNDNIQVFRIFQLFGAAHCAVSIKARSSFTRQAVIRGPSFTGLG
jgi:hypothetical protein